MKGRGAPSAMGQYPAPGHHNKSMQNINPDCFVATIDAF